MTGPVRIHLVTGGKYHDFDLARLVLLNLMAQDERIRVRCGNDFRDSCLGVAIGDNRRFSPAEPLPSGAGA